MCLLSYYPPGVQPTKRYLEEGAKVNRDGHGWAIVSGYTLITGHGMTWETITQFCEARREYPSGPAMFHSRFGTSGERTIYNCHPFPVGGDPQTVVAHNGIISRPGKDSRECDTRLFAAGELAEKYPNLDDPEVRTALERRIGSANKLVVLTVNPQRGHSAYILNAKSGHWHKGDDGQEWHSNWDFLPFAEFDDTWTYSQFSPPRRRTLPARTVTSTPWKPSYTRHTTMPLVFGDLDTEAATVPETRCDVCMERGGVDADTAVCLLCGFCNDCLEPFTSCGCFIPGRNWNFEGGLLVPPREGNSQ